MREIKNQRGFTTLEIILVVAIVGIFSSVTVPKIARIFDRVYLDYETKSLYSELNFARSVGKSSTFDSPFYDIENSKQQIEFWIYSKNYPTENVRNRYTIRRDAVSKTSYFRHDIQSGIDLDFNGGTQVLKISFNNPSRYSSASSSKTLTLNSKYNGESRIVFDSVGRWRGEYVK